MWKTTREKTILIKFGGDYEGPTTGTVEEFRGVYAGP